MAQWPHYSKTRHKLLGLSQVTPTLWRYVCLDWEGGGTKPDNPACVGPHYRTKTEALSDLDRYVTDSGWGPYQ